MSIPVTPEERTSYLTLMLGGANRLIKDIYGVCDKKTQEKILALMADYNQQLEPVMDMYGLGRDARSIARIMLLTEDIIGCEPVGKLVSANETEAIRHVMTCPWKDTYDGETCRLHMAALQKGLVEKQGLEVICEQTLAEGADHCVWIVRKRDQG